MDARGMSRSAPREQRAVAAIAHGKRGALPAGDAAAFARRVPFSRRKTASLVEDQGCREIAGRSPFLHRIEKAEPLSEAPAFAGPGLAARRGPRAGSGLEFALQRGSDGKPDIKVVVERADIGKRLVAGAAADPEAETPPPDREDQMPLAFRDDFCRDPIGRREFGKPQRGKARRRRLGDGDQRAGPRLPDGRRLGGAIGGIDGERPTPNARPGGRTATCLPRATRSAQSHSPCDRPGCGAGIPARNRRDHIVRI